MRSGFIFFLCLLAFASCDFKNKSMAKLENYGRQHRPDYYFEGEDLRIAQSIYNGETYLLNNLSKDRINTISSNGMSLFLYTIYADNEEAMNILLKKGGDVNMFTQVKSIQSAYWHEMTPLSIASMRPKISYIKTLLLYGADINDNRATPALLNAIKRNDREMVDYLLDNGANINIQQAVTKSNALLQAADINDYDMANHLLDRGADPMLRNADGDCLAYTVQFEIKTQVEKGRGTEKYKKTLLDLKKRLESMGVVFPVEKIPPSEDDNSSEHKPAALLPAPPPQKPTPPTNNQAQNQNQNQNKRKWTILFDDDDDNCVIG